jgi:hypothetical protein
MRALVVYESMFGCTQEVARAVADGLGSGADVQLVEVGAAPPRIGPDVDLLVVGGPTHAFGMTRPGTREDAARQAGGPVVSSRRGIREWLDGLTDLPPHLSAATFDTRVSRPRVPGSAAHAAHRHLRRLGAAMAMPAETFWVEGTKGPVTSGEQERARAWARQLVGRAGEAAVGRGRSAHPH